ncbi:SemiSWEET transporter [Actinocorallia sp. B10E7]|uniref:SemiSWEET family sugar transporter n=1 Tax=Actinocorallia sp. B10E7 TaxID=3153558 RepID=UPI00325F8F66
MTILGLVAGALTTGCWLPQLLRTWRTRSTDDFSWVYLGLLMCGVGMWLAYGLVRHDAAITVANALTLLALLAIAAFKAQSAPGAGPAALRAQPTRAAEEIVADPRTVSPS